MPTYRFEALDAAGRSRFGSLDAPAPRGARDELRAQGLLPVEVVAAVAAPSHTGTFQRGLPAAEVSLITRQLATLLVSGTPLEQSLAAVGQQAERSETRRALERVRDAVVAGQSLAQALAGQPQTFSSLYRGLVAVGGETGQLAAVLERLADYLDARQALKQKIGLALIYPVLVAIIAVAVIAALMFYVVPQVVAVFQQSRQTLPWLTQALIAFSAFLRATWGYWLAGLALAAIILVWGWRLERFRAWLQTALLGLPGVGKLLKGLDTARFASTLAILVASGAPLLRALEAASGVLWLLPMRDAAGSVADRVRQGVTLSRSLEESKIFPPLFVHLVASGEASGRLPALLERASVQQEREVERRLAWLTGLIEPVMIVLLGGVVLILVLAVMLPIVSMNQLIR
ncbi:MAG: type II secretion system inner membrane protein GspF [Betaproteobacteria bacterium]